MYREKSVGGAQKNVANNGVVTMSETIPAIVSQAALSTHWGDVRLVDRKGDKERI